jgi:two-component system chemotaxis sensor kinase CheA
MTDLHRQAYREEASELLAELEASLLELEDTPGDRELIGRVFRALHTIKGSGAMFGFDDIARFTHEVETVFDAVREGRTPVTAELIGVTLAARDHIQALLRAAEGEADDLVSAGDQVLTRLRAAAPGAAGRKAPASASVPALAPASPAPDLAPGPAASYRIHFDPAADIFLTGANPILMLEELQGLGGLSLIAHVDRIPDLEDFDPERCYTYWDAVLTTGAGENAIRDVFVFVDGRASLSVQEIPAELEAGHFRIGELLVERGDVAQADLESCLAERPLVGEALIEAGLVTPDRVEAAALEQRHLDGLREKRQKAEAASTLRVPAARLDSLVNIVGELVTVQARLSGYAGRAVDSEIVFIAEEVERLTNLLRENTMSIRMLPIRETFNHFKRLVRDLSSELKKKAELVTEGNETELDKSVIEQLRDPLVHLVRNAVDHGIEAPERRRAAGKPEVATVHISASYSGAFVLIRVSDDGAGFDREAIRARAVTRGLIASDAVLSDQQIDSLVLTPGFSTANQVTEISGRGVGMDVVQRSLDAVRGSLAVASTPGRGTEVTLRIPLTLAIIDGLLVKAGAAYYVVPVANVSECLELIRERSGRSQRRSLVEVRGELVPCVALRERFAIPGEPPEIEQAIIAETHDGRFGFVVDRVIGDYHTVIKKLGNLFRHVDEVSGATILGDGTVALILDVEKLAAGVIRDGSAVGHRA